MTKLRDLCAIERTALHVEGLFGYLEILLGMVTARVVPKSASFSTARSTVLRALSEYCQHVSHSACNGVLMV